MGSLENYISLQDAIDGFQPHQKRWKKSGLSPDVIETIHRLARAHHGLQGVNDILEAEQFRSDLVTQEPGWQCHSLSQKTLRRLYASQRALVMFIGYLLEDLRTGDNDPPASCPSE
jgi:hypothetical protein